MAKAREEGIVYSRTTFVMSFGPILIHRGLAWKMGDLENSPILYTEEGVDALMNYLRFRVNSGFGRGIPHSPELFEIAQEK